jgi:hypothetical protein
MRMKKMLCGLLVAVLVLTLVPVTAFAAGELWVNGQDILAADGYTVQCGEGTAVYDPDNAILTLTNATLNQANLQSRVIDVPSSIGELTIRLVGDNTIENHSEGIMASCPLTIDGQGTLTITTGTVAGLISTGDMVIDGATVTVTTTNDGAIQADGANLTLQNGATLKGTGKYYGVNAQQVSVTGKSTLITAGTEELYNAILANTSLIAEDSTITGTSDGVAILSFGPITLTDSTVTATSTSSYGMWSVDLLSIAGHSTVTTQGGNVGMDGNSGVQISAPSDGYVEILVGDDAESAQPSASSPVGPGQNVSVTDMGNYSYAKVAPHTHELTHVPAVAPTPAKPGNIEYWLCEACGTYFADAEGAQEITEADTYLAPEGTADIPGSNEDQVGGGDWDWPSSSGDSSTGGFASGTTTGGKENPSTGDSSLMAGVVLLAAVSAGGILLSKKRK